MPTTAANGLESQLVLEIEGVATPGGPGWEALPEAARAAVVAVLARLLAKAGLAEGGSDA